MSGGNPAALDAGASRLSSVSGDLDQDGSDIGQLGGQAAGAAPDEVGSTAESVLAALGGAVTASAVLTSGLSKAASMAADQLVKATGGAG